MARKNPMRGVVEAYVVYDMEEGEVVAEEVTDKAVPLEAENKANNLAAERVRETGHMVQVIKVFKT